MDATKNNAYLRIGEEDDIDLLFEWANDPDVRKNAFHTEAIPYETHQKWFKNLMQDDTQVQYIFMVDEKPAGQIRLSLSDEEAVIDYSIAPDMRGRGYGKVMLELVREEVGRTYPFVRTLIGKVKKGNLASANCFAACGYEECFTQFELKY